MQKCFAEGSGLVYQDVLSWLQSSNLQLQLSGALAIANFARNGRRHSSSRLSDLKSTMNNVAVIKLPSSGRLSKLNTYDHNMAPLKDRRSRLYWTVCQQPVRFSAVTLERLFTVLMTCLSVCAHVSARQ